MNHKTYSTIEKERIAERLPIDPGNLAEVAELVYERWQLAERTLPVSVGDVRPAALAKLKRVAHMSDLRKRVLNDLIRYQEICVEEAGR